MLKYNNMLDVLEVLIYYEVIYVSLRKLKNLKTSIADKFNYFLLKILDSFTFLKI
jgi:hypothetical protein